MLHGRQPYFSVRNLLQIPLVAIALSLAVLVVLRQANPFTTKLGRDSGTFAYAANEILHGKTLYLAVWDNKPPGIFFINAFALWLGRGTRWGIWTTEFFSLVCGALAGYYGLLKRFGVGPALLSSFIWLSGLSLTMEGGNFTEEYSLFLGFICLVMFTLTTDGPVPFWMDLAFGVAFGANFLIRPNNVGVQISIILTWLAIAFLRKQVAISARRLIIIGAGFALPLIGISFYFVAKHAFQPFLEATFLYNLSYVGGHPNFTGALVAGLTTLGFAAGFALVGIGVAIDQLRFHIQDRHIDPIMLWIILDFVTEILLSGLSGRNYTHYFMSWLPCIAFGCALVFNKVFLSFSAWSQRLPTVVLVASIAVTVLGYSGTFAEYGKSFTQLGTPASGIQYDEALPRYVNEHSQPGNQVLVWGGETSINFLADRESPTPYISYPLFVPSQITDRFSAKFYDAIQAYPPLMIVDPSSVDPTGQLIPISTLDAAKWSAARDVYAPPHLAEFLNYVHEHYMYRTSIAGVAIYRLIP